MLYSDSAGQPILLCSKAGSDVEAADEYGYPSHVEGLGSGDREGPDCYG